MVVIQALQALNLLVSLLKQHLLEVSFCLEYGIDGLRFRFLSRAAVDVSVLSSVLVIVQRILLMKLHADCLH